MNETEPSLILSGKTALIAGASRGIGLAIAKQTAAAGAHTILASRNIAELAKQADALKAAGSRASSSAAVRPSQRPMSISRSAGSVFLKLIGAAKVDCKSPRPVNSDFGRLIDWCLKDNAAYLFV